MEKNSAAKKNHGILIILGIIMILIVTVLFQNRKIHDLEKLNNIHNAEKEQAGSTAEEIPSENNSVKIYSEKNKTIETDNDCQNRINKLESKLADMQEWQDYLEETLKKESGNAVDNDDRIYQAMKSSFTTRFKSFAEENNLSESKKTEFIDLLMERELELRELYRNRRNPDNIQKDIENIRSNYEDLISNLLSEDYAAYKEYVDSEQDRNLVRSFSRSVFTGDNKLNKQQEKDLASAIYRERQDFEATDEMRGRRAKGGTQSKDDMIKMIKAQKNLYSSYLEAAKDILTDHQMNRFKEYIDIRIASYELTEKQIALMPERFISHAE